MKPGAEMEHHSAIRVSDESENPRMLASRKAAIAPGALEEHLK